VGTWLQIVADIEASENEAAELARKVSTWFVSKGIIAATPAPRLSTSDDIEYLPGPKAESVLDDPGEGSLRPHNTVSITTGRTVFHTYQDSFSLICEKCGAHNEDGAVWAEAVGEWYDDRGPGILACEKCGFAQPITRWRFDPDWGFGFLGFTFRDWPSLDRAFIEDISTVLGHKIVYIYTKL